MISVNDWATQNKAGRDSAKLFLSSDNIPALVSEIKRQSKDDNGFSVGFLYAIGMFAEKGALTSLK